jgi:hypothetical protein
VNSVARFSLSLLTASVVVPIEVAAYLSLAGPDPLYRPQIALAVAWLASLAHLILLGGPVFALLHRRGLLNITSASISGFLGGALPLGILGYPSPREGYSSSATWYGGHVHLYVAGHPTMYAWLAHLEDCLIWGGLGVISAVVFWWVWVALNARTASHATGA